MNIWKDRNWVQMLLKELDEPFDSQDYIFELKFDGIRASVFVDSNNVYIQSRNKKDLTSFFPELKSMSKLVKNKVIFDGEIVSFHDNKPSFSKVVKRLHIKDKNRILSNSLNDPATFVAFDILYEDKDLTSLPLIERKKYLSKYKDSDNFLKIKYINKDGVNLFKSVKKMGLEGIVAKNKKGLYHINKRTDDFIKIKNIQRDEFFVGGYEKKKDGMLSLSLGEFKDNEFLFVGKVSIRKTSKIYNKVIKSKNTKNYFIDFDEDIIYIKPIIKCLVEYLERTSSNHLRHPIYKDI